MSEEVWSWQRVVEEARQRLVDRGLPVLSKPVKSLDELAYPEDVEALSSLALANAAIRHQAWYSYATVELAVAVAELRALEEIMDVLCGERMHAISKTEDGRVVKDVLRALAIQSDPGLKAAFRKRVELEQTRQLLEGLVAGLGIRCRGLESESIRRMSTQKLEAGR